MWLRCLLTKDLINICCCNVLHIWSWMWIEYGWLFVCVVAKRNGKFIDVSVGIYVIEYNGEVWRFIWLIFN